MDKEELRSRVVEGETLVCMDGPHETEIKQLYKSYYGLLNLEWTYDELKERWNELKTVVLSTGNTVEEEVAERLD